MEYSIMCASMVMSAASLAAVAGLLANAGVSSTGGLLVFAGTGGIGAPFSIAIEAEADTSLAASGVCAIAGVAVAKIVDNSKDAFNKDNTKLSEVEEAVAEAISKIERGLSDIRFTGKIEKTAEELNAFWKSNGYVNPPYKLDIPVYQIKLTEETSFVKVYDGVNSNEYGQFVMKLEDITNTDGSFLTAQQIKDKYALEFLPKYVADAKIPAGTTMNCGIAGPIEGWGSGGGLQFDLNWQKVGSFTYRAILGN